MLGTEATVLDPRHGGSRPGWDWVKWVLVAAIVIFIALWVFALMSNAALQKRVAHAEQAANERAEEIRQMARKCGIAAMVSLERLGDPDESPVDEDQTEEETSGLDGGIDTTPSPLEAERW